MTTQKDPLLSVTENVAPPEVSPIPVSPDTLELGIDLDPGTAIESPQLRGRVKRLLIGKPRDLADQSIFTHISLVAFLAWVGLGADGLSSSCYGPAEAFANLGGHRYLAVFLAMAIMATVLIISACYTHIIEEFPSGGGGYLVASKLLGRRVGVISGCALLVDYVLTVTVSVAAAGEALFGLVDPAWAPWKVWAEGAAIVGLIILNLRGVKESVQVLLPIFLIFLLIHVVLIFGSLSLHLTAMTTMVHDVSHEVHASIANPALGLWGMLTLMLHAYSLGAGTYTGIEAVSNSMPVMREPRVATAKRTMFYMAFSLAITAGGLMIAYLLLGIEASSTKTMNQVLTEAFVRETGLQRIGLGGAFLWTLLISEGALLIVAAQAGFIDGPRVLSNMAHDSWAPHWFANLSERLATHNGIVLMGVAALAALFYTSGAIRVLIVMYSINVFVTFSLSMIGMCRHWLGLRGRHPLWLRRLSLFLCGAVLCLAILAVTVVQKFDEGGWRTLAATGLLVAFCFLVHRYYRKVTDKLLVLDKSLRQLAIPKDTPPTTAEPDPTLPAAVILVGRFSGLGIHTMLNAVRFTPGYFRSFVFVSAGVVDSGNFKGSGAVQELRKHTIDSLEQYVVLARQLGMPATSFMTIGTDPVDDLQQLCQVVVKKFPKSIMFAGQLVFQKDNWIQRLLHNQTAYSLQRRLQWAGIPMVILPTRVR